MNLFRVVFSSLLAVILAIVAVVFSSEIIHKENISPADEKASNEDMLISIEDEFFAFACESMILRAGYDCPYPNEFDLDSKENDPNKEKAYRKGAELCEKEARNGNIAHQECLTHYFDSINKDKKQALFWANQSASQGSSHGMMVLCRAYGSGEGVLKDPSECMKWIFLARAAGSTEAKKIIKTMKEDNDFENFQSVKIGHIKAHQWVEDHPEVFFNPDESNTGNQ